MKNILFVLSVCAALASPAAKPTISNFSVTNDVQKRTVIATYDLDVAAVVTAEVQTNESGEWKPLVGANSIAGANHKLAAGTGKTVTWALGRDFPGMTYDAGKLRLVLKAWDLETPPTWMVVDPTCSNQTYYSCKEMIPGGIADYRYKSRYIVFRKIPAKGVVFRMGSGEGDNYIGSSDKQADEVAHLVTFTKDWYMAIYECTQAQWMNVLNTKTNPSSWATQADNSLDCPVSDISYNSASDFPATLSRQTGLDVQFPTEAEWEYSCRAGSGAMLPGGFKMTNRTSDANLAKIAWYTGNSTTNGVKRPHPVGTREPNAFDMYDILGNIREWTRDCYHNTYGLTTEQIAATATTPVADPCVTSNPGFGTYYSVHVKRGGNYLNNTENDRCGGVRRVHNDNYNSEYGFRVSAPAIVK